MTRQATVDECVGTTMTDTNGERIGEVKGVYFDEDSSQPEWFAVGTGFFGHKLGLVPVQGSTWAYGKLVSGFVKDQVKHAPHVDADGQLSQDEEARLYAHYGIAYTEHTGSDAIDADPADGDTGVVAGRLRKIDESEHETTTIAVPMDVPET
jgi:hypothetical protein